MHAMLICYCISECITHLDTGTVCPLIPFMYSIYTVLPIECILLVYKGILVLFQHSTYPVIACIKSTLANLLDNVLSYVLQSQNSSMPVGIKAVRLNHYSL